MSQDHKYVIESSNDQSRAEINLDIQNNFQRSFQNKTDNQDLLNSIQSQVISNKDYSKDSENKFNDLSNIDLHQNIKQSSQYLQESGRDKQNTSQSYNEPESSKSYQSKQKSLMSSYANNSQKKFQNSKNNKFLESFKLPQFFKESTQQLKLRKKLEKEYKMNLMKAKDEVGLMESPDQLIEGMSQLLAVCGITDSFIDDSDPLQKELKLPLWQIITMSILSPFSIENRIFKDNLIPKIEQTNHYREMKKKQEEKLKKKLKRLEQENNEQNVSSQTSQLSSYYDSKSPKNQSSSSFKKNSSVNFATKNINKVQDQHSPKEQNLQSSQDKVIKQRKQALFGQTVKFQEINIKQDYKLLKETGFSLKKKLENLPETILEKKSDLKNIKKILQGYEYQLKSKETTPLQIQSIKEIMIQTKKSIELKQCSIEIDEYFLKNEFLKAALLIIGSQKKYKKKALQFMNEKQLPGISPIKQMIEGKNDKLKNKYFQINFQHLLKQQQQSNDLKLCSSRMSHQTNKNTESKKSKQYINSSRFNISQFIETPRIESDRKNIIQSELNEETNCSDSIIQFSENLKKLKLIRNQRKQIYQRQSLYNDSIINSEKERVKVSKNKKKWDIEVSKIQKQISPQFDKFNSLFLKADIYTNFKQNNSSFSSTFKILNQKYLADNNFVKKSSLINRISENQELMQKQEKQSFQKFMRSTNFQDSHSFTFDKDRIARNQFNLSVQNENERKLLSSTQNKFGKIFKQASSIIIQDDNMNESEVYLPNIIKNRMNDKMQSYQYLTRKTSLYGNKLLKY